MTSYSGKHAEYYDIFYASKPYEEEAHFVHEQLQSLNVGRMEKLLELACGTGSHALALEKFGYRIIATDYSDSMLACARKKAVEVVSSVDFRLQDMRNLAIPERPFDAVICLFDSIGYVTSNEGLFSVFRGVRNHLRDNGLFIFEFWHAAAMLRNHDAVRVARYHTVKGEILRLSETEIDTMRGLGKVKYTVYELGGDGTYSRLEETITNRFFQVQEMGGLLSLCGLAPVKWFAGYGQDEAITEETWHIVGVARRSE
jgi:SAM-dependent methyltransferase